MTACGCEERILLLEDQLAAARQELAIVLEQRAREESHYQLLRAIIEGSRDAIWSWTRDGTINSWNAEAERLLQYTPDEIIGKSLLVLVAPERLERARGVIANLLEGGWYEKYDTVRVRKDGTPVPVELTVSPIRNAAGAIIGGASMCRDVTVRKEQERALRESEERFSKLFQLAPVALSLSTLDEGRYIAVNSALLAATGYTRDEVVGHTARELQVYTDPADFKRIRQQLASSHSIRNLEVGLRAKDGRNRISLFSAEVIDLNGKPCLLVAVADITEQKKMLRALELSQERYEMAMHAVDAMVYDWNVPEGRVERSAALEQIIGFRPDESEPTVEWWRSRIHPDDRSAAGSQVESRLLAGEERHVAEYRIQHRDGHYVDVADRGIVMYDERGRPRRVVGSTVDVTERKDAEARQLILLRELQHRTKNMLAVIQSVASQTLKRSGDLDTAHDALVGRLHALAKAQEFVAAGASGGVLLRQLVEAELAAFDARATLRGSPLVIGSSFAQTLALVIHELATNATKHGALSSESGRLEISWDVDGPNGTETLNFSWLERGGPLPQPPKNVGFGTTILRMAGDVTIEYKAPGLAYRLSVPFDEVVSSVGE